MEQLAMDVAALPAAFTERWQELEAERADETHTVLRRTFLHPTRELLVVDGRMWGPVLVDGRRIGLFGEEPRAAAERLFKEVTRG